MKTCSTCQWWGFGWTKDHEKSAFWPVARPCGKIPHDDHHTGSDPGGYLQKGVKAEVLDGSGYFAALRTAADFGCVLHEEGEIHYFHGERLIRLDQPPGFSVPT